MMLMSELQYWSLGKRVYYHFDNAYGVPAPDSEYAKRGYELVFLGKAETVRDALRTGRQSRHEYVNEILDAERRATGQEERDKL